MAALRDAGRVAAVGFCWGGSLAWLAATRLEPAAAVCYYGGQIVQFKDERPRCPVLLHFGETDPIIPPENVDRIRAAQPEVAIHTYPAGHGFHCDARGNYHAESASKAWARTLDFLEAHLR